MDDPFIKFLQDPSRENFLAIRDIVIEHPDWQPYGTGLEELSKLLDEENWDEFIEGGRKLVPDYLLSPSFHMMRSFALNKLEDEESADMEAAMAMMCIQGIKSTGDGTQDSPWLVTRTLDEYDVLRQLSKEPGGQALIEGEDGRRLDRIECTDGSEYFFDVTDCMKKLNDQFK
jgi:hypothetical protein